MKLPKTVIIPDDKLTKYLLVYRENEKFTIKSNLLLLNPKKKKETMLKLYERVSLNRDFPEYNLKKGDIVTLVDRVPHPTGGEEGYVLEVFNSHLAPLIKLASLEREWEWGMGNRIDFDCNCLKIDFFLFLLSFLVLVQDLSLMR